MHVVLQLCSTLTRTHYVAVCFLDGWGVSSLLSLPTSSLFPGFDNVAATIIRYVLEDPQTLQHAMEAEIKHSLVAMASRHSNGRAVKSVCHVEMVGNRPYVVLVKDRDKDKCKEKENEKEKTSDKDKAQLNDGKAIATVPGENEVSGQDASTSLAKIVFILKLLTEILLMYASSVHVLLRRDGEISSCRVPHQRGSTSLSTGGIFYHILHMFIPYS
ncbi:hypothetical protein REPUB_Repub18cG0080200 [Reevesia pubescens]